MFHTFFNSKLKFATFLAVKNANILDGSMYMRPIFFLRFSENIFSEKSSYVSIRAMFYNFLLEEKLHLKHGYSVVPSIVIFQTTWLWKWTCNTWNNFIIWNTNSEYWVLHKQFIRSLLLYKKQLIPVNEILWNDYIVKKYKMK